MKESLAKYQDVYAAVREGYFSTVGCVHYTGEEMDGHVNYAKGAMGITSSTRRWSGRRSIRKSRRS